jgi:hypothetical protein
LMQKVASMPTMHGLMSPPAATSEQLARDMKKEEEI